MGIPWSVLTYSEEEDGYIVPITEEFLALAPKLDISELSGWGDTAGGMPFTIITEHIVLNHIGELGSHQKCDEQGFLLNRNTQA